jgi:alpha-1,2-mannosyltransferase
MVSLKKKWRKLTAYSLPDFHALGAKRNSADSATSTISDNQTEPPHTIFRYSLLLIFFAAILTSGIYFARLAGDDPQVYKNDFNVFYFASQEVIAGRDPYQRSIGAWTPYLYPPLLAEMLIPLALAPLPVAAYFWFLINVAALVVALKMLTALNEQHLLSNRKYLLMAGTVVLLSRFILDNLSLGQVNLLVATLAMAHVYFFAKEKKIASSLALAVAVSIKLTPAILIVWHLAKRRFKFAAECAVLIAALMALSFIPFGRNAVASFETFVNRTIKNEQGFDFAYAGNQSLRGAIARITGSLSGNSEPSSNPASMVFIFSAIVLLAVAVWTAIRARGVMSEAAPFFCLIVLLSPLSWKAHFIMLLLPVFLLFKRAFAEVKAHRVAALIVLIVVFALFNLTSPKIVGLSIAEWADAHSLVFAAAALLFAASALWHRAEAFVNLKDQKRSQL